MPHTKSAAYKARANRLKAERRWAEYLFTRSDSLLNAIQADGIDLNAILLYNHAGLKRHLVYESGVYSDVQQIVRQSYDQKYEFEIYIVTGAQNASYTYFAPFETLIKGALIQPDDITFRQSYRPPRDRAIVPRLQKIIYEWIHTQIMKHICARRSEKIRGERVAAVWHPRRVARRLEEGGWEDVEAFA